MNELSKYTDKELRQELYMRNKKNKISEKDKEKCLNCVHRICYSNKDKKIMGRILFGACVIIWLACFSVKNLTR